MKTIATLIVALSLTGCATGQYEAYTAATTAQAVAASNAQAERYKALARLADSGSDVAKVAAVMALAGHGTGDAGKATPIAAPRSTGDQALQWAAILVPGVTQAYMIGANVKLGMRQSDNSTALGLGQSRDQSATSAATFAAFGGLAGQIQAPPANITTTTNTTLAGTGVLGSGSYSIGPNSGAQSGNTGRLAGGGIQDSTATPTVIPQPAPVIVRPEVVQVPTPAQP